MNIIVGFPKINSRAEFKNNAGIAQQSILSFSSERVTMLEADVYVYLQETDEVLSPETPHVKLLYVEDYDEKSTFLDFELRATEWAKNKVVEFMSQH
ncbi:conserved hypothetical protein [Xenorhabdus innexi]|uniref:Uncharacterized protein n=2 Tax=Xenorhabdus innexi TaxID=290109 RepID=A0A1N6MXC2_9GAMM|nr:hypothetical protein Xinn_03779 [Xenorhabdus innexi]SIP73528.1 conserved hypothetical protein [Xenorhabdus innexi]